tara:strand:+ start:143 stop:1051 length:909 start_codon:yes stop_codon:yes gene_type:complete
MKKENKMTNLNTTTNEDFGSWVRSDEFAELQNSTSTVNQPKARKSLHKCGSCNGTGTWKGVKGDVYLGYTNIQGKCFKCKGKGGFTTSSEDRAKARASRVQKANQDIIKNIASFRVDHNDLYIFLHGQAVDFNDFAISLLDDIKKYGGLTEKQLAAAYRMLGRQVAYEEGKKEEAKPKAQYDLSEIKARLVNAETKVNKAKFIAGDNYEFSLAPASGKNFGSVYVKYNKDYLGKINEQGEFFGYKTEQKHLDAIREISENILESVIAFGRKTGKCGCCNRKLTNKASVELGIGPICKENFGL